MNVRKGEVIMRKQERDPYVQLLIDLLKTVLLSFVFYFISVFLLAAILEGEESNYVSALVAAIVYAFYFIAFYLMHARRSMDDYSLNMTDEKYSFKEDFKVIFAGDGKRLAIIYGVLAVVMDVCMHLPFRVPVTAALFPLFPIYMIADIPVLIVAIGWFIITVGSILTIAYSHRRVHTLKAKGKL